MNPPQAGRPPHGVVMPLWDRLSCRPGKPWFALGASSGSLGCGGRGLGVIIQPLHPLITDPEIAPPRYTFTFSPITSCT